MEKPGDKRQNNGSQNCRRKALNDEPRHDHRSSPEEKDVYKESSHAERQNWNREGDKLENGFNESVYNPNDHRSNHRRPEICQSETRNQVLNHQKCKNIYGKPY